MPTLDWIGKKAVVNHHREVPFHILKEDESLSFGKKDSGNLIVEGDNLVTLKALLPYYKGKVKCIYIDPPYNTGNEGWVYNDNVNSPEIKKWLGQVVGKEMEDLSRHDKWLCMMYPRLSLLKEFLSDDGVIFISIDNNEVFFLKILCDEIFQSQNFISCISCINNPKGRSDQHYIATAHESIIIYRKSTNAKITGFDAEEHITRRYNKIDENGKWREIDLRKTGSNDLRSDRPNMFYPIYWDTINNKISFQYALGLIEIFPMKDNKTEGCWRWGLDTAIQYANRLFARYMPNKKQWSVFEKDYFDPSEKIKPTSVWDFKDVNSERGTEEFVKNLRFDKNAFPSPKPVGTIKRILQIASNKDSLILDSFAGSGTTAQAVLELNKEDGGNRKFILCEMLPQVAEPITRERAKRVIERDGLQEQTGFKFAKHGEPIYSADGDINPNIKYADLARHVFFMATGTPLAYNNTEFKTPLIGVSKGVAIYLLYNGILGDNSVNGENRLTQKVLKNLPKHDGVKIIYGTACGLSEMMLRKNNIVFRQIPYSIFDK